MPKDSSGFPRARSPEACKAAKGDWVAIPDGHSQGICRIPTPDSGVQCRDSDECASYCIVKVRPEPMAVGDEVLGRCMDTYQVRYECLAFVEDGQYRGEICID
jgi:hypothetical protein